MIPHSASNKKAIEAGKSLVLFLSNIYPSPCPIEAVIPKSIPFIVPELYM
jgi:hypothetical protein